MTRPFCTLSRISVLSSLAALVLPFAAFAQDPYGGTQVPSNTQNSNQYPVARGAGNYPNGNNGPYGPSYNTPNAIPEGTRFIAVLDDKLETKKIQQGKKF